MCNHLPVEIEDPSICNAVAFKDLIQCGAAEKDYNMCYRHLSIEDFESPTNVYTRKIERPRTEPCCK